MFLGSLGLTFSINIVFGAFYPHVFGHVVLYPGIGELNLWHGDSNPFLGELDWTKWKGWSIRVTAF